MSLILLRLQLLLVLAVAAEVVVVLLLEDLLPPLVHISSCGTTCYLTYPLHAIVPK